MANCGATPANRIRLGNADQERERAPRDSSPYPNRPVDN